MQKIRPFLWFDGRAVEAAKFYLSIFKNAELVSPESLAEADDSALTSVTIRLEGQELIAFNGGPHYTFSPATSFTGRMRIAGRGRLLLGAVLGGQRRRRPVRLAGGQVRRHLADRSVGTLRFATARRAQTRRRRKGDVPNDETRHRDAAKSLRHRRVILSVGAKHRSRRTAAMDAELVEASRALTESRPRSS